MTEQQSLFDFGSVENGNVTKIPDHVTKTPIPVTIPVIPDAKITKDVTKAPENETPAQWALRKWEELAVIQWSKILAESIEQGDKGREEFSRKLLKQLEVK
jgi:hypothetical protein